MFNPLVSVIIPCFNHEKFIQDCIQSVLDQTYQNIELIIIDDGSCDGSIKKIQEMLYICKQRFVRFEFRYRSNKGLSATLNEGLEWCEGEYLAPFGSDDIMKPENIEKKMDFLSKSKEIEIYGVFSGYELIDQYSHIKNISKNSYKKYSFNEILMHQFELPAPTALLNLKKVREVGGYDENLKIEDWFMWLKLTEKGGQLIYLDKVLCQYRMHEENTSKKIDLMYVERIKVLDQFKNSKNYLKACKNIEWYSITDSLATNKSIAFKRFFELVNSSPLELFSKNMIRFIYYFLKIYIRSK